MSVKIHQLQLAVLHEINELFQPRQGILEMEVDVRLPSMPTPACFTKQDICSLIHHNRLSKALIYFHPKYSLDKTGRDELYADLGRAALIGGDRLTLWGKGKAKLQSMYIRCQCAVLYRGSKVDKATGKILERSDNLLQPTATTVRINDMVRKGGMHLTELVLIAASPKMAVVVPFHFLSSRMTMVTTLKPPLGR